jgi:formylglycine-generating enzyme required for sulfatase activity
MKPTTTSVFVSPVRPQKSLSRMIHGSAGRAAGAQWPSLPAAQDGQTKSLSGPVGGDLEVVHSCRLFLATLLVLLVCGSIDNRACAENKPVKALQTSKSNTTITVNDPLASPCTLSDQNTAPAMVAIRPGQFVMGSPDTETGRFSNEGPQHTVTIPKPFAISRCEITVKQFKQFVQETGYKTTAETVGKGCNIWNPEKKEVQQPDKNWNSAGFSQTEQHPVVCVSWQDAQHFVQWLSQRTGALYRLPTEAEWEYAARADSETARYFGDQSQCDYANGLGQEAKMIADTTWILADCPDGYVYTAPVGSFKPNTFGLYDTLGNVYEWTQDCWHDSYQKAPLDGSVWLESEGGACDRRVVRGGLWIINPRGLRSANRSRINTDDAYLNLGFRVARAL